MVLCQKAFGQSGGTVTPEPSPGPRNPANQPNLIRGDQENKLQSRRGRILEALPNAVGKPNDVKSRKDLTPETPLGTPPKNQTQSAASG